MLSASILGRLSPTRILNAQAQCVHAYVFKVTAFTRRYYSSQRSKGEVAVYCATQELRGISPFWGPSVATWDMRQSADIAVSVATAAASLGACPASMLGSFDFYTWRTLPLSFLLLLQLLRRLSL